jgi:hypothetical protein
MDMQNFYRVLVQALQRAHHQGWNDRVKPKNCDIDMSSTDASG